MARVALTDKFIKAVGRVDYLDSIVPSLALRVTKKGHRTFVLVARFPTRPKNPTRRVLDAYGAITLDAARERAHNALGHLQRVYNWAIGMHEFGLTSSPVTALKPKDLIDARQAHTHFGRCRAAGDLVGLRGRLWLRRKRAGCAWGLPLIQRVIPAVR